MGDGLKGAGVKALTGMGTSEKDTDWGPLTRPGGSLFGLPIPSPLLGFGLDFLRSKFLKGDEDYNLDDVMAKLRKISKQQKGV